MTPAPNADEAGLLARHLRRARIVWAVFALTAPVAAVAGFLAPRLAAEVGSPLFVTGLVLAACLWVAFTAERDARLRLERAKLAFAVHGDATKLQRDHRLVLLVVLLRLEFVVIGGLLTAVWGAGPRVGLCFVLAGGALMALAWPTERKSLILLRRARELLP
jgi:hypothetical protein